MTRKTAREIAVQLSFAASGSGADVQELLEDFFESEHFESLRSEDELFAQQPDRSQMEYIRRLLLLSDENRAEIDDYISRFSKSWKVERISKTALAILRCAVCEILYMDDIPNAAAINEAVEMDKGYDEPDTVAFVNGVLGGIVRSLDGGAQQSAAEEPAEEPAE